MSRRRSALAASLVAAAALLSACGNSPTTAISQPFAAGDGAVGVRGSIHVLNALVVAPPTGGTQGVVSVRIVNDADKPDALLGVSIDGKPATAPAGTAIPPHGAVGFGTAAEGAQIVTGATAPATGSAVKLSFLFQNAGTVEVTSVAYAPSGIYADYLAPAAVPTPTA